MNVKEVDASAVKAMLDSGESVVLVDVREAFEVSIARIAGATHIPLGQLQARADEIPQASTVVVFCHHGMRSLTGAYILMQAGRSGVASMAGGIEAWSRRVDSAVPRY